MAADRLQQECRADLLALLNFEQGSELIAGLRALKGVPEARKPARRLVGSHGTRARVVVGEVFCLFTHSPKDQMPK